MVFLLLFEVESAALVSTVGHLRFGLSLFNDRTCFGLLVLHEVLHGVLVFCVGDCARTRGPLFLRSNALLLVKSPSYPGYMLNRYHLEAQRL